jgi:nitrogen fixation protein NifB
MSEGSAGTTQTMTAAATRTYPAPDGRHRGVGPKPKHPAEIARLHLPVSPACNIACAYCNHEFDRQDRSAAAQRLLTPTQAVEIVGRARALSPALSVVGIAGPGEPLATHHALETFAKVHHRWPDLALCLSTNGLMLPERIDAIAAIGVTTLTVTVNAVDPEIQAQIAPAIIWRHRRLDGVEAAERLIDNQLEGIARAAERGITVKVNTVLIPTVNEDHIGDIAEWVAHAGAHLINILPLLPQHGFTHLQTPGLMKRYVARADAERHLRVSNHCQHCGADACETQIDSDPTKLLFGIDADATFSHG